MSEDIGEAVRHVHLDIQDIFRVNSGKIAQACIHARDLLSALPRIDTDDPSLWGACKVIYGDLGILLGFMTETSVPWSEPAEFRVLVLDILWYLYAADLNHPGFAMAEEVHRRWTTELGAEHLSRITACERHATFLYALDKAESALPLFREALHLRSRSTGRESPYALDAALDVCACLNALGDYHTALRLSQDIICDCERVLGSESRTTIRALDVFAGSMFRLGEHHRALDAYTDAYQRCLRVHGTDHLLSLNAADNMAIALAKVNDHQAACALNEEVLQRYGRLLEKKDKRYKKVRNRLIVNLRALGRNEEADALTGLPPDFIVR